MKNRKPLRGIVFGIVIALTAGVACATCPTDATFPSEAQAAGYCMQTFPSDTATSGFTNVDLANCRTAGHDWYPWQYFDGAVADMSLVDVHTDGSATLHGDSVEAVLTTIAPGATLGTFVGTAFGGGAYFEARLKIGNVADVNHRGWWPAFWAMAAEHLVGLDDHWANQDPSYEHFIETDFMEQYFADNQNYLGVMHDWEGCKPQTTTCVKLNGDTFAPPDPLDKRHPMDDPHFDQFHTYGFLWIPAKSYSIKDGSATWFFDGKNLGTVYFKKYSGDPPLGEYSVIDSDHLPLILTSGLNLPNNTLQTVHDTLAPPLAQHGVPNPSVHDTLAQLGVEPPFYPYQDMTVEWVKVWQIDGSNNLTGGAVQACQCTYSLSSSSDQRNLLGRGGNGGLTSNQGTFQVYASYGPQPGCYWRARSLTPWLTIVDGASGYGNGTVTYKVAPNTTGAQRFGTITAGGQPFIVTQGVAQ